MLIVEGDPDCRSAGSFFKNPVLSEEQHEDFEKRAAAKGLTIPSYPALEKRRKVSAAWLVEHSGFARGYGFGHVGISSKHALAIVNRGGATAAEILALKDQIQQRVEEIWGVRLEPEPVMVGFCTGCLSAHVVLSAAKLRETFVVQHLRCSRNAEASAS